ncbi:CzcE family metal-binding protein [Oxalobacteraceae bacterium OM1]|nr:CzcE family metal-binding protein [Oxalobacteraceae bacterium OM1]
MKIPEPAPPCMRLSDMQASFSMLRRTLPWVLASMLFAACATRPLPPSFYGDPADVRAAEQTIVITPQTRFVNLQDGTVVAFAVGDKRFAWSFMAATGVSSVRLNDLAPPGVLDHEVRVYLSPDPRYIGGGDHDR